jgi:hypothetical protein
MRARLGYALELIFVLAVGLALARWATQSLLINAYFVRSDLATQFQLIVASFFAGVGLVGGFGTWLEAARRSSPPTWGIGRWTWSVYALTVLLAYAEAATVALYTVWKSGDLAGPRIVVAELQGTFVLTAAHPQAFWALAALWLTSRITGQFRDPAPDAREWVGRVSLALIVAAGIAHRVIGLIIKS